MSDSTSAIIYLVLAGVLIWLRQSRVRQGWLRTAALVLALVLAYPALNLGYIAVKHAIAGR